jgi:hypothetical protein
MRKKLHSLAMGVGLVFSLLAPLAIAESSDAPPAPRITVEPRDENDQGFDWKARTTDITQVLGLGASQLLPYFPGRRLDDILVRHQPKNPATLYDRGPRGEYLVMLSATDTYWAQYTFQFAHELGHIVINPDHHSGKHQWLVEALCDASSMFVLSRMRRAWDSAPPIPGMSGWGSNFDDYLGGMLAEPSRKLPAGKTMALWLAENLPALSREQGLTARSQLVAAHLFPIFRDTPAGWESLSWWPREERDLALPFAEYLKAWRDRVPDRHKAFVGRIQALFGV